MNGANPQLRECSNGHTYKLRDAVIKTDAEKTIWKPKARATGDSAHVPESLGSAYLRPSVAGWLGSR